MPVGKRGARGSGSRRKNLRLTKERVPLHTLHYPPAHAIFGCLAALLILLGPCVFSSLALVTSLKAGLGSDFPILEYFRVLRTAWLVDRGGLERLRVSALGSLWAPQARRGPGGSPWGRTLTNGLPRRLQGTASPTLEISRKDEDYCLGDRRGGPRPRLLGSSAQRVPRTCRVTLDKPLDLAEAQGHPPCALCPSREA